MSIFESPAAWANADRAEVSSLAAGHFLIDGDARPFQGGRSEIAEMPTKLARLARQSRPLTSAEEYDLAVRCQAGDEAARQKLIVSHFRLILKITRDFAGARVPVEDLFNEGVAALAEALKKFDPNATNSQGKGTRLASYAWKWIEGGIRKAACAPAKFETFNPKKGGEALASPAAVSFARSVKKKKNENDVVEEGRLWEEFQDPNPFHEELIADREEMNLQVKALLEGVLILNEREQRIFKARRMTDEPVTLEILSAELGVSKERVRQIEISAFEKVARAVLSQ
jgi:RNA polymerase sigma-32 factor